MNFSAIILVLCMATVAMAQIPARDQLDFKADIWIKEPNMKDGVAGVKGVMYYSYTDLSYIIEIPSQNYREVHSYNITGLDDSAINPFRSQYVFQERLSDGTCQAGVLDNPFPLLFFGVSEQPLGGPHFEESIGAATYNAFSDYSGTTAGECHQYRPTNLYNRLDTDGASVTSIAFKQDSSGYICYARLGDGRRIYFENVERLPPTSFARPSGCKCAKRLDVCLVVDRSASIDVDTWNDEKEFLLSFAQQFTLGPDGTALSIVAFNTDAYVEVTIDEGMSQNAVRGIIQQMSCDDTVAPVCQEGFTSISMGIDKCAAQLAASKRVGVQQVMVVVTDGYHNVIRHPEGQYSEDAHFCYPECYGTGKEGSPEWVACATDPGQVNIDMCPDDLRDSVNDAYQTVGPELVTYAIGVRNPYPVSDYELGIIANGNQNNVLKRNSFAELARDSLDIVARTCDETATSCDPGCCGFCVFGECKSVDFCDDQSICTDDFVVTPIEGCCKHEDAPCEGTTSDPSNKCLYFECYEEQCIERDRDDECPKDNACFTYSCRPTSGKCEPTLRDSTGGDVCVRNECDLSDPRNPKLKTINLANDECDQGNACFTYGCVEENGAAKCTATKKKSPAETGADTNVCHLYTCDAGKFTFKQKDCGAAKDICHDRPCDPKDGCGDVPVECRADPDNLCDLSTCDLTATSVDTRCKAEFVKCDPFEKTAEFPNGDLCRPLSTASRLTNGCDPASGQCVYKNKPCKSSGCEEQVCNSSTGECEVKPRPGCGTGLCLDTVKIEAECISTECIDRRCDPDSNTADNCEIEIATVNCLAPTLQPDFCTVADPTYFHATDPRKIAPSCDPTDADGDGDICLWKAKDCDAFWADKPALDVCKVRTTDPNHPDCCIEEDKCVSENPCVVVTCLNGECLEEPKCSGGDACTDVSCDNGQCVTTPKPACEVSDPCFEVDRCDPVEGCILKPVTCDDGDLCTLDICVVDPDAPLGRRCENPDKNCDDLNACSVDTCNPVNGECEYEERVCDDNNACTVDFCDIELGCQIDQNLTGTNFIAEFCDDNNYCTNDTCVPELGCQNTEITCYDDDLCTIDECNPFRGCDFIPIVCEVYEECLVGFCDIELAADLTDEEIAEIEDIKYGDGPGNSGNNGRGNGNGNSDGVPMHPLCNTRELDCYDGLTQEIAVAAGLATGVIVGIIVGIVLCFACAGGGIYAASNMTKDDSVNSTLNNPLYKGDGNSGNNPLYKNT